MKEIKILGRGGQGAVTGAQILATAAFLEGYWAQSFPQFGAERRGAPVIAYLRLADEQIAIRSKVYTPDVVIVMDFNLFKMAKPLAGLKSDGTAIINCTDDNIAKLRELTGNVERLFSIDATLIAHETYGKTTIPITNVILIGAYCAAAGDVSLESIYKALPDFFPDDKIEINRKAARMGYENLKALS
ncbi:MAG: 2-oxoacid:acceptor oxidoreductase family protein [Desulfobacterales bacterium]|nr:MAG: 2-oxoacid:acceptor oxidoreductase family protein [Desulfobacterales bacterium]